MKKLFAFSLIVFFALTQLSAQDPIFHKGDRVLNLGLGLGSALYTGSFYKMQVPPLSAALEIGVVDEIIDKGSIGVGPYLGFASYKWEYSAWGYKYTNIIIGGRGNFHYPFIEKFDTYTGLLIGFNIVSAKEFGNFIPGYDYSSASSGLKGSWFVGGRYYFTETIAGMVELGFGIAYLNLGVSFKL